MQSLSKQTFAYAIGTILSKIQSFLLLPIITHYLAPHDYGVLETLTTLSFLLSVFSALNLDAGIGTYYHEQINEHERRIVASSGLWLNLGLCIFMLGVTIIIAPLIINRILGVAGYTTLFIVTIFTALLTGISNLHSTLLRLKFETTRFNLMTVGGAFLALLLSLTFVIALDWGISGIIWANFFVAIATSLMGVNFNRAEIYTRPDLKWWKELLKAGLPLLPFSLAAWVLASLDRTILISYRTWDEVGIYALAARIAGIASILFGPFQTAWWPFAMAAWQRPGAQTIFVRTLRLFVLGSGVLTIFIAGISPFVLRFLMPMAYFEATRYVGLLVVCSLLIALYFFPLVSLMLCKQAWIASVGYGIGALVNILLNFLWIPTYGIAGATWATVIGYVLMLVIVTIWAHHLLPIAYPYGKIASLLTFLIFLSAIPYFWVAEEMFTAIWQLSLNFALYLVAAFIVGVLDREMLTSLIVWSTTLIHKLQVR